jgi:hypothetical protein
VEYVLSFSPWIAFGAFSAAFSWRVAVIAAFAAQTALGLSLLRRRQLEALSIGSLIFFGGLSAIALIAPHSSIHRWIPALSAGALAFISVSSLLAGRPFTLAIAPQHARGSVVAP